MAKIILFCNVKGGVGKTTLCALFANYLSAHGVKVTVYDADVQASLYDHRKDDQSAYSGVEPLWQVNKLSTKEAALLSANLDELKQGKGVVLIDCPGNINDVNQVFLYKSADAAVIPFLYDRDSAKATIKFSSLLDKQTEAQQIFVPNAYNAVERRKDDKDFRASVISLLRLGGGEVTDPIMRRVFIKKYSTLKPLDKAQLSVVEDSFKTIVKLTGIKLK